MNKRAQFKKCKYGMFVHYVPAITCDKDGRYIADINELANAFDAEKFAEDLKNMGMEYVIFTAWHFATVPLYPSEVMKRWRPGKYSNRDMLGDLIASLKKRGIQILLYTHPRDGHDFSAEDKELTGWGHIPNGGIVPKDYDYEKWNQFINELYEEITTRYHKDILGFFLDEDSPQSDCFKTIDYVRLRQTIKSIDDNLVLLQNFYGSYYCCDLGMQEYGPLWNEFKNLDGQKWPGFCRSVGTVVSANWMAAEKEDGQGIRYKTEDLFRYTILQAATNTEGGGVAWAAGPYPYGQGWERGVESTFCKIGSWLKKLDESFFGTVPSKAYPTVSGTCIKELSWGVALTSEDGFKEYLHILQTVKEDKLRLPKTQDGTTYKGASLLDGTVIEMEEVENGYEVSLSSVKFEEVPDVVIALEVAQKGRVTLPEWFNCTDRRIAYVGDWTYERWERCYGEYEGAIYRCMQDGSYYQFGFEGSRIEIISNRHEELGECDVYVDDVLCATIDCHTISRQVRQVIYQSDELYGGIHKVKVVKKSGLAMELNAFKIYA